jgi:hypothetical protein
MARTEKSLKAQNAWLMNSAIVAHLTVFAVLLSSPELLFSSGLSSWIKKAQGMLAPGAVSLALITIISLVLRGIVPSSWRDRIVHWRWNHPLPGSRAFTEIGPKDSRVDMADLERKYGPLPTALNEQNRKFYSIYTNYKDALPVLDAHRSYLATRDLAMISAPITLLLPLSLYFITGNHQLSLAYATCLIMLFVVLCIATHVRQTNGREHISARESSSRTSSSRSAPEGKNGIVISKSFRTRGTRSGIQGQRHDPLDSRLRGNDIGRFTRPPANYGK